MKSRQGLQLGLTSAAPTDRNRTETDRQIAGTLQSEWVQQKHIAHKHEEEQEEERKHD